MHSYKQRYIKIINKYIYDKEALHSKLDKLLLDVLKENGFEELAKDIEMMLNQCWYS